MKRILARICQTSVAAVILLALVPMHAAAAGNTIDLTSSATTVKKDGKVEISVHVTTSNHIDTAQAYVTYDSTKLEFDSITYTGSPLTDNTPESTAAEGYYRISRYKLGGPFPTGTFLLAKLTLRASASSGEAKIGIDKSKSYLYEGGKDTIGGVTGTSVSLTAKDGAPDTTATPSTTGSSQDGTVVSGNAHDNFVKQKQASSRKLWYTFGAIVIVAIAAAMLLTKRQRDARGRQDPSGIHTSDLSDKHSSILNQDSPRKK